MLTQTKPDRYKAALVDLDGTLARSGLNITPTVADAIGKLATRILVGIVSSRDYEIVGRVANKLGLTGLQVSEGGARIFDLKNNQTHWLRCLKPDDARRILQFLEKYALPYTAVQKINQVNVCDIRDVTCWQITRVTATSLTESQARDIAENFNKDEVHAAIILRIDNGDWMVDFTNFKATKSTAVKNYAAINQLHTSQIIGAGDSYNDLPLLEACGLRIAMGNGAPELKAIADYVAPEVDQDGLAVAIEEFIFPRLD